MRDEYDVVTSSVRNGQRNRPPRQRIIDTQNSLIDFSFDELLLIVKALLDNFTNIENCNMGLDEEYDINGFTEEEIENLINFKDLDAKIKKIYTSSNQRVYNTSIIMQLKNYIKENVSFAGVDHLTWI